MAGGGSLLGVTARSPALRIWACGCTPLQCARIFDAARRDAEVRAIPHSSGVLAELRAAVDAPDVLVLSVSSLDPRDAPSLVREIIESVPRVALVAYCDDMRDTPPSIGALAAAGVHQFLFFGVNDRGTVMRALLQNACHQRAAETVMAALRPCLPSALHPMVEATLGRPDVVTDVRALANALGVHRKTLFNRCAQAGPLNPTELLTWTRLALVGHLLASTAATVETIAIELAWASPTALRNTMKRYTGARATEIRRNGGLQFVVERLSARFDAKSARLHLV